MKRNPSHAKEKKRNFFPVIIVVLLVLAVVLTALINIPSISDKLKEFQYIKDIVTLLDFSNDATATDTEESNYSPAADNDVFIPKTVRIPFVSENADSGAPAYVIRDGVAPKRLEFTLYNIRELDIDAISKSLNELSVVKDIYSTIMLDDSMRSFTIELNHDVVWDASEYNSDGYIDLTLTDTGVANDDIIYIVRSNAADMGENIASLAEQVSDFSPSIVKTQSGKFSVIAGACSTEDEAMGIMELLNSSFFIEECSVFSNPK